MKRIVIPLLAVLIAVSAAQAAKQLPPLQVLSITWERTGYADSEVHECRLVGVVRNNTQGWYDLIKIGMSVLDAKTKEKVATQTAYVSNAGPGEKCQFRGEPPIYLDRCARGPEGKWIGRIDRITGVPRKTEQ